jgi:hypothetical protein
MGYYLILEYHNLRASGLEKIWTTDKEKRHKIARVERCGEEKGQNRFKI